MDVELEDSKIAKLEILEKYLKRILFKFQKPIVSLKQRILMTIIAVQALEKSPENALNFFEVNIDVFEKVFYQWEVPRLPLTGHDIKNEIDYASKNPKSLRMFVGVCEKAFIESDLTLSKNELMNLCKQNVPNGDEEDQVNKNKSKVPKMAN